MKGVGGACHEACGTWQVVRLRDVEGFAALGLLRLNSVQSPL